MEKFKKSEIGPEERKINREIDKREQEAKHRKDISKYTEDARIDRKRDRDY